MNLSESYRSPKMLSYLAIIGLVVASFCNFFMAVFGIGQIINPTWMIPLENGKEVPVWLTFQGLVVFFKLPAYIFTIVVFSMWVYRTNKNLSALRVNNIQHSPGWAVIWWFIPIISLFKPFFVISEIWKKSEPDFDSDARFTSKTNNTPDVFYFWWFFWVVSLFATNASSQAFDVENPTFSEFSGYFFVAAGILSIIAAFLAVKVVRTITHRQEERFQRIGSTQQFVPQPPDFN